MNTGNQSDYLDSLLFAAAKDAGKSDVTEFEKQSETADITKDILGQIPKKNKTVTPSGRHISFRSKLMIAFAAALGVCILAVGTIASFVKNSATADIIITDNGPVLTYNITGTGTGREVKETFPEKIGSDYAKAEETILADGISAVYKKDETAIVYNIRKLSDSYRLPLGDSNAVYAELKIGDTDGCISVTEKDDEKYCIIAWNDGKYAYELCGNTDSYELFETARALAEKQH